MRECGVRDRNGDDGKDEREVERNVQVGSIKNNTFL